jgi:hypothetical protein
MNAGAAWMSTVASLGIAWIAAISACGANRTGESDVDAGTLSAAQIGETLAFGPIRVPAGQERTQCVTKRLSNTRELKVGSIHNVLMGVSHHLVVYRVDDPDERPEPYDCQPFEGTLSSTKGAPLMITQKHDELLTLGEGLAFVLEPAQMIRLEIHYINTTRMDAQIEARSTFIPIADSKFQNAVGFLFSGTLDVTLPPGEATQVEAFIEAPIELYGKKFIGFTGHTHRLGTNVRVQMGKRDGEMASVYDVDGFSWQEPPTVYLDPPLSLPADGRFHLACDYSNDTEQQVGFGESANAEMCFFWGYYYPSEGSFVCAQTTRSGVPISTCCPGSIFCGGSGILQGG